MHILYSVHSGIVQSLQMSVQHRMYDEAELKLRAILNSSVGSNTVFYHNEKDCLFNEVIVENSTPLVMRDCLVICTLYRSL